MRSIAPRLGEDFPEVTLAEEQAEYLPITVAGAQFANGVYGCVSRWRLTEDEVERLARGEDLYLTLLTFGHPMQPISLSVGVPDWVTP